MATGLLAPPFLTSSPILNTLLHQLNPLMTQLAPDYWHCLVGLENLNFLLPASNGVASIPFGCFGHTKISSSTSIVGEISHLNNSTRWVDQLEKSSA